MATLGPDEATGRPELVAIAPAEARMETLSTGSPFAPRSPARVEWKAPTMIHSMRPKERSRRALRAGSSAGASKPTDVRGGTARRRMPSPGY